MLDPEVHLPLILFALILFALIILRGLTCADTRHHLKSPLCSLYGPNLSQSATIPSITVTALWLAISPLSYSAQADIANYHRLST